MVSVVDAKRAESVVLMVVERDKEMLPVNTAAFTWAQNSERFLNNAYRGALVISDEGSAKTIDNIEVLGYFGKNIKEKIYSVITRTHKINVRFSEVKKMDLNAFKELVVRYLQFESEGGDPNPYLPQKLPLGEVDRQVRDAASFAEVFRIINVPKAQDCLDIL